MRLENAGPPGNDLHEINALEMHFSYHLLERNKKIDKTRGIELRSSLLISPEMPHQYRSVSARGAKEVGSQSGPLARVQMESNTPILLVQRLKPFW